MRLPTLEEALRDLADLGWVDWYVTRGSPEDYLPQTIVFDHYGAQRPWYANDTGTLAEAIWQKGDKRFLYVETGCGLNHKRDGTDDDPRYDIQAKLSAIEGWRYAGSGCYSREIDPTTDSELDASFDEGTQKENQP
jgi:hypothetical protein